MKARFCFAIVWLVLLPLGELASAQMNGPSAMPRRTQEISDETFSHLIVPLLKEYCFDCHNADLPEADIDLSQNQSLKDLRRHTGQWLKVRDILRSGQMPPKDSEQMNEQESQALQSWIRDFLLAESEKSAGDPGPVLLRRLNNEEYNYVIQDLTGVIGLEPTREFPVDGAAGEGFINTGAAQAMSPSFVSKYLAAAKEVASHVVFLPDGLRFSKETTRRDQTDAMMEKIREFYSRYSDSGRGSSVNLQGIQLETNHTSALALEAYFTAALGEREAIHAGLRTIE
ncbi:MAG: DUF1587 domain-containing protein, partial [Planctomycetota bacterium]